MPLPPDPTLPTRGFRISSEYREQFEYDSPEWKAVSGLIRLLTDELIFAEAQEVEDTLERAEAIRRRAHGLDKEL